MSAPTDSTALTAAADPIVIGRRALTTWHLTLLAFWVFTVVAILLGAEGSGLVALVLAATGWLVAAGPAVVFLAHTRKHRDEGVGRVMRRSATGSAIALIALGLLACLVDLSTRDLMMPVDLGAFRYLCYLFLALGVAVVARAWTARAAPDQPERYVFRHQGATGTGVLLALLATVMLPKFSGGSETSAYRSVIQSDLRNLVVAQEIFFMDSARYARTISELPNFWISEGATEPLIDAGADGWSATMTHARLPGMTCGVAVNATNPVDAYADSAQAACR
ncbi:MAG: hypothetical protein WD771_11565 [Gemmatimonadaceae bacterium]